MASCGLLSEKIISSPQIYAKVARFVAKKNVHTKMITDQPVNETFCPDGFVGLNDPECEKKNENQWHHPSDRPWFFFGAPRFFGGPSCSEYLHGIPPVKLNSGANLGRNEGSINFSHAPH